MIGFRLHDLFNESGSTPSDTHRICDWSVFSSRLSDFQVCFFFPPDGIVGEVPDSAARRRHFPAELVQSLRTDSAVDLEPRAGLTGERCVQVSVGAQSEPGPSHPGPGRRGFLPQSPPFSPFCTGAE